MGEIKRQALVVGINRYSFLKDGRPGLALHLEKPAGDAEAIAQLLEKPTGELAWNVQRLPEVPEGNKFRVGDMATVSEDELKQAILELFQPEPRHVPDVGLLFFAGHGLRQEPDRPIEGFFAPKTVSYRKNKWSVFLNGLQQLLQKFSFNNLLFFIRNGFRRKQNGKMEGFLATSDTCPRKNKWGISLSWLRGILLSSPVQKQIVWLDCCHSGELLNFLTPDELRDWLSGGDRCLIVACRDDRSAYAFGEHGLLTKVLLQALDPLQQQEKQWISSWTITTFVREQLEINLVLKRQIPISRNFGEEIRFWQGQKPLINSHILPETNSIVDRTADNQENEERHRKKWERTRRCRIVWGRDDFVEKVLNRLTDPQELSIFSLTGGPGYGKTEVAYEIAQTALKRHLFAEVLWVTARGTELVNSKITKNDGSEILNWDDFLNQISAQLKCGLDQNKVHEHLKQQKYLVVLDNAETADLENILVKLNKMLNPSRAILTTRLKTEIPFVQSIETEGLEEIWSNKLLQSEAEHDRITQLLQASPDQLHQIHKLSCGAPLALHFIIGQVAKLQAIDPVLSALEQANGKVEVFYKFCLGTAWKQITDQAKSVLRYMGHFAATGITQTELSLYFKGLDNIEILETLGQLREWSLIECIQRKQKPPCYDLHPWVRSSVRGNLVDKWQPSPQEIDRIIQHKIDQIAKWRQNRG